MTGLPWFKCYPRDFNDGMMGLTMEERGAYVTILNCIYARGGPVPDEALYFRAVLQCSGKAWSKVRASLIVKGRLFEVNIDGRPCLMDDRAAKEIEANLEMRRELSERGARGGRKSQARTKENKDLAQAPAQAGLKPGSSDTEAETEQTSIVAIAPIEGRASRLAQGWVPEPGDFLKACEEIGADRAATELEKFTDYWRAVPGAKGRKLDWSATYRNWIRRASESPPRNVQPDNRFAAKQQNYDDALTGARWAAESLAAGRTF